MSAAVMHFENNKKISRKFRRLLHSRELRFGEDAAVLWKFIPYLTPEDDSDKTPVPREPEEVAGQAATWIERKHPDRLVFVTDLRPVGGQPPSYLDYGLNVLSILVTAMAADHNNPPYVLGVEDLVGSKDILVVFLTVYGRTLESGLRTHPSWRDIAVRIVGRHDAQGARRTVSQALEEIQAEGPRIVYADRSVDEEWASDLIAQWIRQGDE